nr:hypothetical protein BgiMline_030788 [Biomphalaria glabrata]
MFLQSLSWGCTAMGNTAFLTYLRTYYKAAIIQGHMILWRLTSLEKVFGPLKITEHVMLQKEEDAGPGKWGYTSHAITCRPNHSSNLNSFAKAIPHLHAEIHQPCV